MKQLLFVFAAFVAVSFASCNKENKVAEPETDVDTTVTTCTCPDSDSVVTATDIAE